MDLAKKCNRRDFLAVTALALCGFSACVPDGGKEQAAGDKKATVPAKPQTSPLQDFMSKFPRFGAVLNELKAGNTEFNNGLHKIVTALKDECKARSIPFPSTDANMTVLGYLIALNEAVVMPEGYYYEIAAVKNNIGLRLYRLEKFSPTEKEAALMRELEAPASLRTFTAQLLLDTANETASLFAGRTVVSQRTPPLIVLDPAMIKDMGTTQFVVLANELGNVYASQFFPPSRHAKPINEMFSDLISLAYSADPASFAKELIRIYDSGGSGKTNATASQTKVKDDYVMSRIALTSAIDTYNKQFVNKALSGTMLEASLLARPKLSARSVGGIPLDDSRLVAGWNKNPQEYKQLRATILMGYIQALGIVGVGSEKLPKSLATKICS